MYYNPQTNIELQPYILYRDITRLTLSQKKYQLIIEQ
jgi:hypothetical protein